MFIARIAEMRGGSGIDYFSQIVTWDFETDTLEVAEPIAQNAKEFAWDVR